MYFYKFKKLNPPPPPPNKQHKWIHYIYYFVHQSISDLTETNHIALSVLVFNLSLVAQ